MKTSSVVIVAAVLAALLSACTSVEPYRTTTPANCQDVVFSNGGVMTRPGLQALFGPLPGNPTVNYVKTYITPNETLRTMALDGGGNLYKEITEGNADTDRQRPGGKRVR